MRRNAQHSAKVWKAGGNLPTEAGAADRGVTAVEARWTGEYLFSVLQDARYVIHTITFFAVSCPENSAFFRKNQQNCGELQCN